MIEPDKKQRLLTVKPRGGAGLFIAVKIFTYYLFGFDLFDNALVALDEPGFPGAAAGALAAVGEGIIGGLAAVAPGQSGDGLKDQLAVLQHRMTGLEVIPGVCEEVRHDPGDLTNLEDDLADPGYVVFVCGLV